MTLNFAILQIYRWQYKPTVTFYCKLLDLISTSDTDNFNNFKNGFPVLIAAYELWKLEGDYLFRHYSLEIGEIDANFSTIERDIRHASKKH